MTSLKASALILLLASSGLLLGGCGGGSADVARASAVETDTDTTPETETGSSTPIQAVSITTQPSSQAVNAGVDVTLTVAATGTGPLSYQWYRNGSTVSGGNAAQLLLSDITTAQAGNYYCVVSNSSSTATSSTASLSVAANASGQAQISWSAPTAREDGSTLSARDISGYQLYYASSASDSLVLLTSLSASEHSVRVDELADGTHYFALATVDSGGISSDLSPRFSVTIN